MDGELVGYQVVVNGEVVVPCCWESYARQYAERAERLGDKVTLWQFSLPNFARYADSEVEVPSGIDLADIRPAVAQ